MVDYAMQPLCQEASIYLYDCLSDDGMAGIPARISDHIAGCPYCQHQLEVIEENCLGSYSAFSDESQTFRALNEMLGLHFAYQGREVCCEDVKPFLPSLVDPILQIRVVTPITAHIEKCSQCLEDLKRIAHLGLSTDQYGCLSQILAGDQKKKRQSCDHVQKQIEAIALMDWKSSAADDFAHLCGCRECLGLLYEARERRLKELQTYYLGTGCTCDSVEYADVFDYCFPSGVDPASDQYFKFRESLTSHLKDCPVCLAKMQKLHRMVVALVNRPNSDVVTELTFKDAVEDGVECEANNALPVHLEVRNRRECVEDKVLRQDTVKSRLGRHGHGKQLMKAAVFLGAALLIGWSLFGVRTAQATDIEQIRRAMADARNVHFAQYLPNESEPIEERWFSKESGYYIARSRDRTRIWDLSNAERITLWSDGGRTKTKVTSGTIEGIKDKFRNGFGMLPLEIKEVKTESNWRIESEAGQTTTYVKTYTRKSLYNPPLPCKRVVTVDSESKFPLRFEFYSRLPHEQGMKLKSINTAEQVSADQIRQLVSSLTQ